MCAYLLEGECVFMKKLSKKIKIFSIIFSLLLVAIITLSCFGAFDSDLKKASRNLTSYAIEAVLREDYTLSAKQHIEFINNTGDSLDDICLHLYPRAFREDATILPYTSLNKASCFPNGISYGNIEISKVNIGGEPASFEWAGQDGDILLIHLSESLKSKKEIDIDIDFDLTIPNCTHRFGYYNSTINLGNWYPIVCAYQNGEWETSPYYSTGDPFVSECANYTVQIDYPQQYSCYATGNRDTDEKGKAIFSAQAVRDFAIVLNLQAQAKSANVGNINITYVGYQGDEDIDDNIEISLKAMQYFGNTFGKYPYKNLVVIKSAFCQGGMEYPNLVIISDNITNSDEFQKVIIHEIAHQWWYGVVGNNQISQAWLDESLAEYSTCLFYEDNSEYNHTYQEQIKDATASYLLYVDVISSLNGKVNTAMNLPVNKYTSEYEYTYMIYVKGVVMLDSLRETIGKDKLIKALKKYYRQNSYKIANEEDFISACENSCHIDLQSFFSGWLGGTNVIGYVN